MDDALLVRANGAGYATPAVLPLLTRHAAALAEAAAALRRLAEILTADGQAVRTIRLTPAQSLEVQLGGRPGGH